jgi:hypothetical protein
VGWGKLRRPKAELQILYSSPHIFFYGNEIKEGLGSLGVGQRVGLTVKWGFNKDGLRKWTGFFRLRLETRENSCEHGNELAVSVKGRGIFFTTWVTLTL